MAGIRAVQERRSFDSTNIWSYMGGPWEGNFRYAAIIHDYFCHKRYPDWEVVHQNFYNGMLAKGVSKAKAWIMHRAVYEFGPRWRRNSLPVKCEPPDYVPDQCFINKTDMPGELMAPLQEINKENLETFILNVRSEGYSSEADELRDQPEIRRILSK